MTTFHVVRSVKGGSGKTAFALRKVICLAAEGEKKKVLYIDADVHASDTRNMLFRQSFQKRSMSHDGYLFFSFLEPTEMSGGRGAYIHGGGDITGNEDVEQRKKKEKHSLNTYIHPYKGYYSTLGDLRVKARLTNAKEGDVSDKFDGRKVSFIFSDPTPEGREVFGSLSQSSGKSAVGVGAYTAKMKALFEYISKSKYTDIVLDMPPGSDVFSEHLMESIANFVGRNSDKNELEIYYVATRDLAHIRTAAFAAMEHLHLMETGSPLAVNYIDNMGVRAGDEKDRTALIDMIKQKGIGDKAGDNSIAIDSDLEKLTYWRFENDSEYSKTSNESSNEGLRFDLNESIIDKLE